jgi:ArsR family transcriptional regulator, arsenate/arsenite/antimonite-responsive transcriptional repressor
MDIQQALLAFDALSQETRLKAFRLLVERGTAGAPAGKLSEALDVPHNTLSFHLTHMGNAGLISVRRDGRSMIYSANFTFIRDLIRYMVEKCCSVEFASLRENVRNGSAIIELINCCTPKEISDETNAPARRRRQSR